MLSKHEPPAIGSWYLDIDHTEQFEIVAADLKEGAIEIQYFGGEVEELDLETWYSMRVVSIAAPKDWSGPYEIDKELFTELKDESLHPYDGHNPLDDVE